MNEFLFFQLVGAMASWGEIAVGEDRQSALRPTRSAVLGLLASALGVGRTDEETQQRLSDGYSVAVAVCDAGVLLRDYHTTQVPRSADARGWPLDTRRDETDVIAWTKHHTGRAGEAILSYRDYRCDGRWVVAVQGGSDAPFRPEELREALLQPKWCLYLGRKACPPSLPLEPQVVSGSTLVDAMRSVRFASVDGVIGRRRRGLEHERAPTQDRPVALYWEPQIEAGVRPQDVSERWDDPLSRSRWQFRPRTEHHGAVPEEVKPCS